MAARVGDTRVDLCARLGWTAREMWWAVAKDPVVWGEYILRAHAAVIAVGGMDHLPASIPTVLRDSIPYTRPGWLRRRVRTTYRRYSPAAIRLTGGHMRQLPQSATDHYIRITVEALRHYEADLPIVLLSPSAYDTRHYPSDRHHGPARNAAFRLARELDLLYVDTEPMVVPSLRDGTANPDGMHYSWRSHQLIGDAVAGALVGAGFGREIRLIDASSDSDDPWSADQRVPINLDR